MMRNGLAALLFGTVCMGMNYGPDEAPVSAGYKDPLVVGLLQGVSAGRIEADVRALVGFETRHTLSETDSDTRGIGAARRWIKQRFEEISAASGGRLRVEFDGYTQQPDERRITRPVEIVNVVATLPGTQPESADRLYVISGHYDSICSDPKDHACDAPGANDDASGTAAVLEAARVMSGHEFEATLVFVAVAGEEQGLFGSKYLADKYKEAGVNVAGMFTNDIIGSSRAADGKIDANSVRVFSEGVPEIETPEQVKVRLAAGSENDSAARQLARFVEESCRYVDGFNVKLIWRRDRFLRGGDHTSFSRAGFPAVRFTELNEDYTHQHQNVRVENGVQYGDLIEFCDFKYIANVTRVNVAALACLANGPAAPARTRVITEKLTTDTTLQWDPNREPDLAGYEIVWRDTIAPRWQRAQWVGKVTESTLSLSKDNYIFGVRAVDKQGHRSVVSYPQPAGR